MDIAWIASCCPRFWATAALVANTVLKTMMVWSIRTWTLYNLSFGGSGIDFIITMFIFYINEKPK
jgi:hypothetical protein